MKLSTKFYLILVLPLVIVSGVVTYLTFSGLQKNSMRLTHALGLQSMMARILPLMLVQDDASKAILIDPDKLEKYSEAKISAYDELKKLLNDISIKEPTEKNILIIKKLQEIDDASLRPIDTKILETLFENKDEARKLYFDQYDPERAKYVDLLNKMVLEGQKSVESESQKLVSSNAASFYQIAIALLFGIGVVSCAIHFLTKQITEAQAKLALAFDDLQSRSNTITTIYDHLASGFFLIDPELKLQDGFSKSCRTLLGKNPKPGDSVSLLLGIADRDTPTFQLLLTQVFEDLLPEELNLSQLPATITIGKRALRLDYSVIRADSGSDSQSEPSGKIESVMISVSDISNQIAAQEESKKLEVLVNILKSKKAFMEYLADFKLALNSTKDALAKNDGVTIKRILHTLKGNSSTFGLTRLSAVLHEIEENSDFNQHHMDHIRSTMEQFLADNFELLQLSFSSSYQKNYLITENELESLKSIVMEPKPAFISARLEDWIDEIQFERIGEVFESIQNSLYALADRLDKKVELVFLNPEHRIDTGLLGNLIKNLIHIYRNALDHGIECKEERQGKAETAKIVTQITETAQSWLLCLEDDGKGIVAHELVDKALAKGILTPAEAKTLSISETLKLIFKDGFSAAERVTQISGRGVGLAAVAQVVADLNGTIHVDSQPKLGTKFSIVVPKKQKIRNLHLEAKAG